MIMDPKKRMVDANILRGISYDNNCMLDHLHTDSLNGCIFIS